MSHIRNDWPNQIRLQFLAVCYVIGLGLTQTWEHNRPHHVWLDVTAMLLVLCGIGIRLWAMATISHQNDQQIVDVGLYSITRNPQYWGTFLIVIAQCCAWQSVSLLVMSFVLVILYLCYVVPSEERQLRVRFGEAYTRYQTRVPGWWPRWSAYVHDPQLDFHSTGIRREFQRDLCWSAMTAAACWYSSFAHLANVTHH